MCIDSPSHHRKGVKIHCQDVYDRIHLFTNVGLRGIWFIEKHLIINQKHICSL